MLSSVDKIQKFFKLEIERGYDNRAVVGGLDKILPAWESEARANRLDEEHIRAVIDGLSAYHLLEPEQRAETLSQLMDRFAQLELVAETGSISNGGENKPEPKPAENRIVENRKNYSPDPTGLKAPLHVLQGVGSRLSQTLGTLGLHTLEDLLYFFPRRYDDYSQLKPINRLAYGEETTVLGTIQSINTRPVRGGKMQLTEAVISDGTGALRVNWFNQPWLGNRFSKGTQVVLAGKVDQYLGRPTMANPEMELIEHEHLHTNRIVPVYPLTARLNQKSLRRLMYQTVTYWAPRVPDYLPETVRTAVKLVSLSSALMNVHFPESQDMLDVARWRLAFDEIFLLQLGVLRQKRSWQMATAQTYAAPEDWLDEQIARLPFPLTGAQRRVIDEIRADLASGRPMDRLIQGDVGSGKTVVAALTAAIVARQGAQAAVMAPTSILAEQHYRSFSRLLTRETEPENAALQPGQIRLLVGDTPEVEKQEIRQGLEDGQIKLVIGTHALLEAPVQFQNLQLVVVDEQHRFGVAQRATLRSKGNTPHLLVMTATPIPRSLALTVYGDLDLSVMDEMPPGRQPVDTHVTSPLERERAYQLIRAEVEKGHQAFIIYPLVEQAEGDAEGEQASIPQLSAVEEHQRLQKAIFPRLRLGLLHGRLKPDEKELVMKSFRDREFDVLISTTVVEVGVDIPNATVMLIEGANRFGLAQLHQLRGRVGRGEDRSYCLLIPDNEDAIENERLAVMAETNDGFVLAESDLQQRGPGEFLGTRQAGFSELKMANLTDVRLIEKARQQAQNLFQADPDLAAPEHAGLGQKLEQFWGAGRGDIS